MRNRFSFLQRWFKKRQAEKEKARILKEQISKEDFAPFLEKVEEAIVEIIKNHPDISETIDKLGEESARWFNNMSHLNASSFKAGVCAGIYLYLKHKFKETGKQQYVV